MNYLLTSYTSYLKKRFFSALVIIGLGISGCDMLNVNNPNSLVEEDLSNPAAASSIANGAEATATNALGTLLAPYSTVTDEVTWIGTRDAWEQLDQGEISDPINEFADGAFRSVSQARWTADNAIFLLEGFREEGTLESTLPLLRSYAYGAIIYLAIADAFDDFVISDRQDASPPIGKDNMQQLHDTAISYLNKGLALADKGSEWEIRLLALRARAHFSRALWEKLNPEVDTLDPLVQSQDAVDDAEAALAGISAGNDWNYQLETTPDTPSNPMAFQINERLELRFGDAYIQPTQDGTKVDSIRLEDPIDGIPAPYLVATINDFVAQNQYADITVISARELYLIIAEDALARNNTQDFEDAINALRSLDNLSDYTNQIPAPDLLKHSRRVNLFIQGRRLADLYRFGETSEEWTSSRVTQGAFFPITSTEIRSNPHVDF